ncbi:hypothetical protein FKW77_005570 [Venturia effusa]|uniref:Uncharacterized protein n=1 Tax=Venturia effusa TaxID=50376 RepID=A0A517LLJ5_9PEZI|nr:hypothetical protein FKW77_005570 [Venturia effusa]
MSSRNCCTALPRAYTPDQIPNRAIHLQPGALDGTVATASDEPDSRYTSARTEDLQEIRQLFNDANALSKSEGIIRRKSRDFHLAYATKHPSVGELFPRIRNKLSRKSRSKSLTMANFLEHTQLQHAKSELRNTLTSNRGPDSGGYDEDAPELADVEAAIKTPESGVAPDRGRSKEQSSVAQVVPSSGQSNHNNGRSRRSTSLSAPYTSVESRALRRSWSDSSLAGGANPRLPQIRLPSFEVAANSNSWRKAVMHSLQISPSIQNFSDVELLGAGKPAAKEVSPTTDTLQIGTLQQLPPIHRSSDSMSSTGFFKASFDRTWPCSHSAKPSVVDEKLVVGRLREPGRTERTASDASMHLQNMRISQHLRSASTFSHAHLISATHTPMPSTATSRPDTPEGDVTHFSSSPPEISILHQNSPADLMQRKSTPVQRKPTPVQRKLTPLQRALSQVSQLSRNGTTLHPAKFTSKERPTSESGFSTDDVPGEWGHVVKGDDAASSMYSTALESPGITPRPSVTHLPHPSVATIHENHTASAVIVEASDENDPLTRTSRQSSSSRHSPVVPVGSMPENPSTSDLSENSKSSKVSRFKEDFDTSMTKKSNKRNSLANLFSRSRAKRRSTNVESLDGSIDDFPSEPKRLQRAGQLAGKSDAAGMLAKAIKAHHEEKSALFLDSSKVTPRDKMFRQRSASFMRPRGLSTGTTASNESGGGGPSVQLPTPAARQERKFSRSTSDESFLKPDFAIPAFEAPPTEKGKAPARRSASAGRLRPDFSTSIFSSNLSPEAPSSPRPRPRLSIALDPMESTPKSPILVGSGSRSPSFQLNDLPALMESLPPTPSTFDASRPTTGYVSDSGVVDLDDPNLNLGAWSRYPSHTREHRTGSAGPADKVKTRDFAYDINPLNILEEEDSSEDSPRGKPKRKNKKKARIGLPKSRSMMLGKEYFRNYVRLIRSPSVEWLHSGKGHRSSISAGGSVEHPELEVIPPVFAAPPILEEEVEHDISPFKQRRRDIELQELARPKRERGPSNATISGSVYDGSAEFETTGAECERNRRAASSPDLMREMSGSRASDALTWSRLYESCVYLPRASQSMDRPRPPLNSPADSSADLSNADSEIPLLIDSMLARSRASSVNTAPMIANATVPLVRKNSRRVHRNVGSVGSVSSIRASSMDLLKTLAEAEERERIKCLEMLTRQRSGATSRSVSLKVDVSEEAAESSDGGEVHLEAETSTVTYEVQAVAPVVLDAMHTVEASA